VNNQREKKIKDKRIKEKVRERQMKESGREKEKKCFEDREMHGRKKEGLTLIGIEGEKEKDIEKDIE